jgi:hypothetical protein
MATRILGTYKITYDNGATQIKNLISHDDFINIYKVGQDKIYELEKANKFKETNSTREIKKSLKGFFGDEWFTDKSPIFDAIKTGKLKFDGYIKCGGPKLRISPIYYNCKVEQINVI